MHVFVTRLRAGGLFIFSFYVALVSVRVSLFASMKSVLLFSNFISCKFDFRFVGLFCIRGNKGGGCCYNDGLINHVFPSMKLACFFDGYPHIHHMIYRIFRSLCSFIFVYIKIPSRSLKSSSTVAIYS